MRPPAFWQNPPDAPGLAARLLSPLGGLYAAITAWRLLQPGYKAAIPVICIGNINAGGTGKTPTAIALIEHLKAQGLVAAVVSRGYGGSHAGPLRVDPARHSAAEVGDEPLLLAAFAPTFIARNRADGVRAAEVAGAQLVILDDGFQNPSVEKDLSIIVADAETSFGNGLCLPSGPLREPVATGLSRADLVISIGNPESQARFHQIWGQQINVPILKAQLLPLPMGIGWKGEDVIAFAGIGRPEKFFATLRAEGANLIRAEALDDHQPLSEALLKRLEFEAMATGAQLVTTEKDAVRLPASFRQKVLTLPVRLSLNTWAPIDEKIARLAIDRSIQR